MAPHHDDVELLFLRKRRNFVARVAHEADFFRGNACLGEQRTHGFDGFVEFLFLQFDHFGFGKRGQRHAGHVGHDGTGVVARDVDEEERSAFTEEFLMLQGVFDGGRTELRTVHGDADAHGVGFGSGLVAQNENRVLRAGQNAVCDGSQEEPRQGRAAAAPHDDEVGGEFGCFFGDLFCGIADDEGFSDFNVLRLQKLTGGFEDLFGFVFVVAHQGVFAHEARRTSGKRSEDDEKFDFRVLSEQRGAGSNEFQRVFTVGTAVNGNEDFHKCASSIFVRSAVFPQGKEVDGTVVFLF